MDVIVFKMGFFESVNKGMIFLDEIVEMFL